MHDGGQQSSAAAIAVIAVILVGLLLVGGVVVFGGLAFVFVQRNVAVDQMEMARAEAERARAMAVEKQARVEADLVEAEREYAATLIPEPPTRVTIQLDQAGQISFAGKQLDRDALIERLKSVLDDKGGELKVIIDAHEDCPSQSVAAVTAACLEVGMRDVGIMIADERSVKD